MNLFNCILSGILEAWANKFRSLLSMIGILLGVASLVVLMGIAQGMIVDFRMLFESQGGVDKAVIHSAQPPEWQKTRAGASPGRTMKDAYAIRDHVPLVSYVSPEYNAHWKPIRHENKRRWSRVWGTVADHQPIYGLYAQAGRYISDTDVRDSLHVAFIGTDIFQRLFPGMKPKQAISSTITIRGHAFTVIGVQNDFELMQGGRNVMRGKNRRVHIPLTTAQRLFGEPGEITWFNVKVRDVDRLPAVTDQLENTLLAMHRGVHDVWIETRLSQMEALKEREAGFTYSLGTLAVITLLVGGIGIANVMLASINERIREIGVRKAVGARSSDIFFQFLVEAITVSLIGGVLGIAAGYGLVELVRSLMPEDSIKIVISSYSFFIGFAFSAGTGVLSGLYPAIKAARLNPIAALRYE